MATNVNVMYSNWRTGTSMSFVRRLVDVSVSYLDTNGQPQTKSGTITFPDILQLLPPDDLKDIAIEIMLRVWRKTQGIDQ